MDASLAIANNPSLAEMYFAAMPLDRVVDALTTVENNWYDACKRRGLPRLWRIIYAQAFGMDPNSGANQTQQLQFIGPQANYCRFRVNMTRSHIKQRIMMAQGQRPSFAAMAMNNDAASLAQVPVAAKIVDYIAKEAKLEQYAYKALESDGYFGEGFVWARWDYEGGDEVDAEIPVMDEATGEPVMWPPEPGIPPKPVTKPGKAPSGAPKLLQLYPWQVARESLTEESSWAIIKEPISKYELAAEFPEHAAAILALDNLGKGEEGNLFGWASGTATTDVIIVRHFYHKSCKAVPNGRYIGYAGDVPLWDAPCPLAKSIPLVSICTGKYFGTSFGYPESGDLLSMQEMIDELLSQSATNAIKFGNQSLWGEDGVEFDQDAVSRGGAYFTLKQNQKPPQAIAWAEMPEITKYLLEYLPERMNEISGLNSTVRGAPDSNVTSGVFAALMLNIAEKYQGSTQAEYDFALNTLGNIMLEMVRANATNGFAAEVAGVSNTPYMEYFKAQDLNGIKRVQIARQNPHMNSLPGRMEVLNATKDLPKDLRKASVEMLLTGTTDAYTEQDQSCAILIRKENERLMRGIPTEVKLSDDPKIHNAAHKGSLDRLRAQDAPTAPEAAQSWQTAIDAHLQHIAEHARQWSEIDPVLADSLGLPLPPSVLGDAPPANDNAGSGAGKSANGGNLPKSPGAAPGDTPGLPKLPDVPKELNSPQAEAV
jgi:hypothetical protein